MLSPKFSHAPNFSLPTRGAPFQLNDLESRNRVALLFARDDETMGAAISQFENNRENWLERDLILVLVMRQATKLTQVPEVVIARDENGEVARQFGVAEDETAFFLLGKSRFPVALAVDYLPNDSEIFALIDAMPMRQREIKMKLRASNKTLVVS